LQGRRSADPIAECQSGFGSSFIDIPLDRNRTGWPRISSSLSGFARVSMAKVFTMSAMPDPTRRRGQPRKVDPRYLDAQKLLVEAIKYLTKQDRKENRAAIELLSEHFRTQFRMSDRPEKTTAKAPESEKSS
jgi:hypothetical protein